MTNPITQFRCVAIAEGLSYLLLLGWAMPLKYVYGQPKAVQIVGAIHGGLFLLYILTILLAGRQGRWSWARMVEAFIASLLPFGPFYLEYKYQAEFAGNRDSTGAADDAVK